MQHENHRVPVTAVAIVGGTIILSGEGNCLRAYSAANQRKLQSAVIFERQAIHGIATGDGFSGAIIWGGRFVRSVRVNVASSGDVYFAPGRVLTVRDWILNGAFSSSLVEDSTSIALVSAHNALSVLEVNVAPGTTDEAVTAVRQDIIPGLNCILYSACVQWLSGSHCLVSSGTAFGDIIVWSALFLPTALDHPKSQIHYTFSAHEGSVFGIRLSPPMSLDGSHSSKRLLATCSDDRTICLWDVTDLSIKHPGLNQSQRDTGFGNRPSIDTEAPPLLARVMGHTSRIWDVQFLDHSDVDNSSGRSDVGLLSFGEDACVIIWRMLKHRTDNSALPYVLEQSSTKSEHAGKNIWSTAINWSTGHFAHGGADGAVALQSLNARSNTTNEIVKSLLKQTMDGDNFRAYCFISDSEIVTTTDHGKITLLHLHGKKDPTIEQLRDDQPGLRGYSIATSVPGVAFIAGSCGLVLAYDSCCNEFSEILNIETKVAGLLTYQQNKGIVGLLATGIGSNMAHFLQLDRFREGRKADGALATVRAGLPLPDGLIVTAFTFLKVGDTTHVALGSKAGTIVIQHLVCHEVSRYSVPDRMSVVLKVHTEDAVTSMSWMHDEQDKNKSWLYSVGRNGSLVVTKLQHCQSRIVPSVVHRLVLPFGPNIEGLDLSRPEELRVWGFKSKYFIVYDVKSQREIMTVECGGAHRNWAFHSSKGESAFLWTKASKLLWQVQPQVRNKLINSGGHGREIKSMAMSPKLAVGQIIATGAEDTDIKLTILSKGEFRTLSTLKKHNTGVQQVKWSADGNYLFSSGGFEEFFIWKITPNVPHVLVGVVCESVLPNSGTTDLRIMSFDVFVGSDKCSFTFLMVYSDSTSKLWRYTQSEKTWALLSKGNYLTACLTQALLLGEDGGVRFLTAATDGHVALWSHNGLADATHQWTSRHRIHQSTIHACAVWKLPDDSLLLVTGGDDNAVGITRIYESSGVKTILITRAHSSAVTGVAILPLGLERLQILTVGIDQEIKVWEMHVDTRRTGIEGIVVRKISTNSTVVADASGLQLCDLEDGGVGIMICGVGLDLWRLSESPKVEAGRVEQG